jgi:tetratricopeptide (TPR) repeat protein
LIVTTRGLSSTFVRTSWIVVAVCAARLAAAQPAPPAQGSDAPPADAAGSAQPAEPPAVVAFEQGRALMEQKQFAQACAMFETSIKLDPDAPGTMLNLGMCNAELDRLATSLHWFRKAAARASESKLNAAFEQAARDQDAVLAAKVATLSVSAPNKGAHVTLDGAPVADTDLARIEVDAGEHVLEMTVAGEPPVREQMTIVDGQHRNVMLKLPPKYVYVDRGGAARKRAYLVGAAGLGVWALDVGVLIYAKRQYDQTDHPDTMNDWKNVARYGGTTLFLFGGAVVAEALYMYSTAPGKERVEEERAVVPLVSPHGLGVAAYGSF